MVTEWYMDAAWCEAKAAFILRRSGVGHWLEKVSWNLLVAAQVLYGERWVEQLAECMAAHLPGDCQLCDMEGFM